MDTFFCHHGVFKLQPSVNPLQFLLFLETDLQKRWATDLKLERNHLLFRVSFLAHNGALFHSDRGYIREENRNIVWMLSYKRSAIVIALLAAVILVLPSILGEHNLEALVFYPIAWFWLWGVWRLIMPNIFKRYLLNVQTELLVAG